MRETAIFVFYWPAAAPERPPNGSLGGGGLRAGPPGMPGRAPWFVTVEAGGPDAAPTLGSPGSPPAWQPPIEDCLGCAAVVACDKLGVGIPYDLEIATFIDWHPMTLHRPWDIRRIVQRKYDLGYTAAGLLLERIASPAGPPKSVLIGADINPSDMDFKEAVSLTATNVDLTNEGLKS